MSCSVSRYRLTSWWIGGVEDALEDDVSEDGPAVVVARTGRYAVSPDPGWLPGGGAPSWGWGDGGGCWDWSALSGGPGCRSMVLASEATWRQSVCWGENKKRCYWTNYESAGERFKDL